MRSMDEATVRDGQQRLRRTGRRVGIVAFAIIVAGATALWTVQIIQQVWVQDPLRGGRVGSCRSALGDLIVALQRARAAAARERNGERAALSRFRQALLPEWGQRSAVNVACRGDASAEGALSRLDALRYAEEHAVRYEAVALAEQRRQVDAIARELLGNKP